MTLHLVLAILLTWQGHCTLLSKDGAWFCINLPEVTIIHEPFDAISSPTPPHTPKCRKHANR